MLLATSHAHVFAFCRAVLSNVLPKRLLGKYNQSILFQNVEKFIRGRRFETPTLASFLRGMRIRDVAWLSPPGISLTQRLSMSDTNKRFQLLAEMVYYLIDSLLIPLLRTNFHVTESAAHRNRLFYFRHDVWRRLSEPAITSLKLNMLQEIGGQAAFRGLTGRTLGFSQIRLLPKETGMRAITNLKRRSQLTIGGRKFMGRSINSSLTPAFGVLKLEKVRLYGDEFTSGD